MIYLNKIKSSKDFQDFLNFDQINPSNNLSDSLLNYVKNDLNPSHKIVFGKLLGVQAFIGFLTLTFCPQFSLSLTNNFKFFHYLHYTFGGSICLAICGSIFIGSGAVIASYILRQSEIKKIREACFLYYFLLTSIALSSFILFGAETQLNLTIYWFLGASIGGLALFEVNQQLRNKIFRY